MQHRDVKAGDVHVIHDFKFLNIEERDAYEPKAEDLDKICLVVEPYGFFALQSVEPTKWGPLSTVTVSLKDFEVYTKEETNILINKKIESFNISSSEFKCGYTRNGKEVFGIEVDCGALPNATIKLIEIPNHNANYNYWIDITKSYARTSNKSSLITIPYVANAPYHVSIDLTDGKIRIIPYSNRTAFTETKIVLNYTKE